MLGPLCPPYHAFASATVMPSWMALPCMFVMFEPSDGVDVLFEGLDGSDTVPVYPSPYTHSW